MDKQLKYLIIIYTIAAILTFALDWQLPGFKQVAHLSKKIDLDRYLIPDYMTYWQCTHFLTRFLLGYFCPNYWHVIFVVDFGWETLEWYQWNAHNWYDLIWNMLGLITGIALRYYGVFDKYFGFNRSDVVQEVDKTTSDMTSDTKNMDNQSGSNNYNEPSNANDQIESYKHDNSDRGDRGGDGERDGDDVIISNKYHESIDNRNLENSVDANSTDNIYNMDIGHEISNKYTNDIDVSVGNKIMDTGGHHKKKKHKDKNMKKRKKEKEKDHNK
jgi:hypothetical protein